MLNKLANIFPYVAFAIFAGLFVQYKIKGYNLKMNYVLVTGEVTDFRSGPRGSGGNVKYTFEVDGNVNKKERGYNNVKESRGESLIGKHFPVAYEKGNVKNNRMLITTSDFESFSIPFPDSLKWVKQFEE